MSAATRAVLHLYVLELLSGLARGGFLVCVGWTTLVISESVATVGQIFIVIHLASAISGPIVGVVVDAAPYRRVIIGAQVVIALAMTLFGWGLLAGTGGLMLLFVLAGVITIARLTYRVGFEKLIRLFVIESDTVSVLARANFLHLLATSIGTVVCGVAIEWLSPAAGFLLAAVPSLLLAVVAFGLPPAAALHKDERPAGAVLSRIRAGFKIIIDKPILRHGLILALFALPVGQLSNAVLSSFIRDDLGRGSDVFALVDAGWPAGGMLAAGLLAILVRLGQDVRFACLYALALGVATIALSQGESVPWLVAIHALMGFSLWLCRIVVVGSMLCACAPHEVGRVRATTEAVVSLSAIVMCLSPTVVALPASGGYFLFWGLMVTAVAVVLLVKMAPLYRSRQTPD